MDTINLRKHFDTPNECIDLKDFTKYSVKGLEEFLMLFHPLIGKWISQEDIDTDEEEMNENNEYSGDSDDGIFMTGPYCGKSVLKIIKKETLEEKKIKISIESHFMNITYCKLVENLKCDEVNKEWGEHKKKAKENELEVSVDGMTAHYMPTLYEVYVRHRIRQVLQQGWSLCTLSEIKTVCGGDKNKTKYKIKDKQEGEFSKSVEVYLEGDIIPDVILKKNGIDVEYVILDVKYKSGKTNQETRSDRLQILAYAYMWKCKRIGHIFPNTCSKVLPIDNISGNCSVDYVELMCNTSQQDRFKERLCEYLNMNPLGGAIV